MCFKEHEIHLVCIIGRQASRYFSLQRGLLDRSNPSILTGRVALHPGGERQVLSLEKMMGLEDGCMTPLVMWVPVQ